MRLRSIQFGPLFLLAVVPLLFLNFAQCIWPGDAVASAMPGVAVLRVSQLGQVREEVAGGDIDLSSSATRVTIAKVTHQKPIAGYPTRPDSDTEVAPLARPLHRRLLPSSSDEAG